MIPNPERAIIPSEKLEGYSLNPNHSEGQHKAIVFRSALGIGLEEAEELREELRHALRTQEPLILNRNPYGQKYQIDFEMTRGDQQATIKSVWIVRDDEDFPRLVTCYIP
jgi:hypothetical protein